MRFPSLLSAKKDAIIKITISEESNTVMGWTASVVKKEIRSNWLIFFNVAA